MGCVHSVEKEEAVRRCRERKRLMKQLLSRRAELAAAHMAYLQSLRNTGATLRQFTEVDSMIPGDAPALPPSPPLPPPPLPPSPPPLLPPSPPPPPLFSPELRKVNVEMEEETTRDDSKDIYDDDDDDDDDGDDDGDCCTPSSPLLHSSAWDFWDPFGPPPSSNSYSLLPQKKNGRAVQEAVVEAQEVAGEEENWAEANTEFGEEEVVAEGEGEHNVGGVNVLFNSAKDKNSPIREVDDNSSAVSWFTKDTDMAVVVWRSKKTLAGIVKEIDDYFLKAAAGGKDVAVILESNRGHRLYWNLEETRAKSSKSAKVFNALSWSWSSRSLQSCKDACVQDTSDVCSPSSHFMTLEKLYAEEQRLYKEVKDEEMAKFQHKKKTLLLHKLEARDHEWTKTQKIRSDMEDLQSRIISLQESINDTCLSISKLRDVELCPQLVKLSLGLVQMWRTMYECHQVQNHIAQQVNLLDNHPGSEPTTDSHRLATAQLETEATSWHISFCNLLRTQREYIYILSQWVRLTDCLPDSDGLAGSASGIHDLCKEWQSALEKLPDKVAAEAIKSFVSVIHSIVLQQIDECNQKKRSDRLESRLERELNSLCQLEKCDESIVQYSVQILDSNHHKLASKRAKLDSFKKRVEEEKAKYLNSVHVSRAMTLNHLKTSLPNVFQALTGFASVCMQALEGVHKPDETTTCHPEGTLPSPNTPSSML